LTFAVQEFFETWNAPRNVIGWEQGDRRDSFGHNGGPALNELNDVWDGGDTGWMA
jgi:hypothetical protein